MSARELTPMQKLLYDTVVEIQSIKRYGNTSPDYAMMPEVFNSLRAELTENLRQLVRDKILECHQNVNGVVMFGAVEDQP